MRHLLAQGPKSAQAMDAATVRIILDQPDRSVADSHLHAAGEILAFYDLPPEHRRQIYSPLPVRTKMGVPSCTDPGTFGGCATGTLCSFPSGMTGVPDTYEAKAGLSGALRTPYPHLIRRLVRRTSARREQERHERE
jgi:hypothetical protein